MIALNRPNTAGEEQLYFNCRTYHNFSKAGTCSNHCIKVETVTQAVVNAVMEICSTYLDEETLFPIAQDDINEIWTQKHIADRIQRIEEQLHALSGNIEQLYDDKLSGILADDNFQRISQKWHDQQTKLIQQLNSLKNDSTSPVKRNNAARDLTRKFIAGATCNRNLLSNLVERVELDKDRGIYIQFRFQDIDVQ